jgi:hypothetical protein
MGHAAKNPKPDQNRPESCRADNVSKIDDHAVPANERPYLGKARKRVTNHGRLSWSVGLCENGADLSRELNPIKYQHLVRYSPQAVHFPG